MHYFLDVDGVLNRESDWKIPFSVNDECVKVFAEILKSDMDPHIILSSTWRVGMTNTGVQSNRANSLEVALEKYNITIEGATPASANKTRQDEIEYYVRRNGIERYIVFDDDESLFNEKNWKHLYLVNYKTGLVKEDIKKIKKFISRY